MRRILLGSIAALALYAQAAMADETYSLKLPAMGAGVLPGPRDPTANDAILKIQVVDASGVIDHVFYYWGQNWTCLGTDNNPNDVLNYPQVGLFVIPSTDPVIISQIATYGGILGGPNNGFAGRLASYYGAGLYNPIFTLDVARPLDYNTKTDINQCPAENGNCHGLYSLYWQVPNPQAFPVNAGDYLMWAVTRAGLNCPGNAYAQTYLYSTGAPTIAPPPPGDITISGVVYSGAGPWGNANYPAAPGGEVDFAVHVH